MRMSGFHNFVKLTYDQDSGSNALVTMFIGNFSIIKDPTAFT